jgi:hypothetical protein
LPQDWQAVSTVWYGAAATAVLCLFTLINGYK